MLQGAGDASVPERPGAGDASVPNQKTQRNGRRKPRAAGLRDYFSAAFKFEEFRDTSGRRLLKVLKVVHEVELGLFVDAGEPTDERLLYLMEVAPACGHGTVLNSNPDVAPQAVKKMTFAVS